MRKPLTVTILLFLLALGLIFFSVTRVTADVNAASGDVRTVFAILGMPIVIGLRQAGHRRLEFEWGSLVVVVLPIVIGQIWALREMTKRRLATAVKA